MRTPRVLAVCFAVLLVLAAAAAPASAGGWATIELSTPVSSAVVGEPVEFDFQVLQHGMPEKAVKGDTPKLTATHAESGETLDATVTEPSSGHYLATLTFDQPGRWKLHAASTLFPSSSAFPTLVVGEESAAATATKPAADASTVTESVRIVGAAFVPGHLEIASGATVTFINEDAIKHEVAFHEAAIDDSGMLGPGATFRVTFTTPGEYHLACGPHPGMSATIVVK
jgi:plastocyanin